MNSPDEQATATFNRTVRALLPHVADCTCQDCDEARAVDLEHWQDYRDGLVA